MTAEKKYGRLNVSVFSINNDFFGQGVNVSGLITGEDIINQLRNKQLPPLLLLPENMLRHESDVFLDDVTLSQLESALGAEIKTVPIDGHALLLAILELD
jgi:NifB/MoaA-like Fe-S oxidoreductase